MIWTFSRWSPSRPSWSSIHFADYPQISISSHYSTDCLDLFWIIQKNYIPGAQRTSQQKFSELQKLAGQYCWHTDKVFLTLSVAPVKKSQRMRRKKLTRVAAHPPGFCPFTPLKSKEAIHGYSFTCRRQPHSVLKLRISGQRKIFFCAVVFGLQYLCFAPPHDPGRLFHPAFARSCSRILFCGCLQSGKFKWGEKSENWNKSVLKKVPVTIIL